MTNAYAADTGSVTIEFHDLRLSMESATQRFYDATVNGIEVSWSVPQDAEERQILDVGLHAYKNALVREHAHRIREELDHHVF